jgi:hypothetical protein
MKWRSCYKRARPSVRPPAWTLLSMTRIKTALFALGLALPLAACGSSQPRVVHESEYHEISETRALALIAEALLDLDYRVSTGWEVDVGWKAPLEVDLRAEGTNFGVEWVSPVDHAHLGSDVPAPAPQGQLRIVSGRGDSAGMHVLILDTNSYKFHPERDTVHMGEASAREVESRLRRDIRDFVEFERGRTGK